VSPQKKNSFGKNMFAFFRIVQLLAKIVGLLLKMLDFWQKHWVFGKYCDIFGLKC
jgi:hypothetical protein